MANNNLKMCQHCRGLIAANSSVCPLCGTEAHYASARSTESFGLSTMTVTGFIFTFNLVMYVISLFVTMKVGGDTEQGLSFSPNGMATFLLGSARRELIVDGQYWRLLTYAFLHGGVIHILFNSYALIQVARLAEEVYGSAKFICLYLIAAVAGGFGVFFSNSGIVGASGAIFGLIGAMAVYGYRRGDTWGSNLKSYMVQWLIYGAIISFLPGISLAGHFWGLVGGAVMAWFLADEDETRRSQSRMQFWKYAAVGCGLIFALSFVMTLLSARQTLDAVQISDYHQKIRGIHQTYIEGAKLPSDDQLESYRQRFAANITTLENAQEIDIESSALRRRMLVLLGERYDDLKKATSRDQAGPTIAQITDWNKSVDEYIDWYSRKRDSLGLIGKLMLGDLKQVSAEKSENQQDSSIPDDNPESKQTAPPEQPQEKKD